MKADRIREEIDDLVKQEEGIIKDLFDTHLSRAKYYSKTTYKIFIYALYMNTKKRTVERSVVENRVILLEK